MHDMLFNFLDLMTSLFLFTVGCIVVWIVYMYIVDKHQQRHAIRHNYPVIGRFRYLFEKQGEFFRQYFFAQDREEMPFNRAERSWVYRAAKNVDRTVSFGSTRSLSPSGTILFMNHPFPTLEEDACPVGEITFGQTLPHPFTTAAIFNISGMSYGALSARAVLALSRGAKQAGCWMNTGEGGLSPYHLEGGADIVFQIGTAKYGVRDCEGQLSDDKLREIAAHSQVKMFEIKLSQGAKPGKGGMLPGAKVSAEIAAIRGIAQGQDSYSPNRHPDINSCADLLDMVSRIRRVTGKPCGFKLVVGFSQWLDELFGLIAAQDEQLGPDFITIDSADGGTGAAPQPLMDYVGLPLQESLPLIVSLRHKHGLDKRLRIIASGKLITPGKVAWALACGADAVVSARGNMFALGCIQALQCNKNTCPTGITTHNPKLQQGLNVDDKAQRVANYNRYIHYGVGLIAHSCGVGNVRQLSPQHVRIITDNSMSEAMDKLYQHYH